MEVRVLQRDRGKAVILATASTAIALMCMSCGGAGSTQVVPAPTAGFSLSPAAINFGDQGVGTTSAPLTATLTNVGNATLTLSSIQVTGANAGDFSLNNNCGPSLAASAQCTLTVTFAPSAAGTWTATVVFTDNASGSPQTANLTGTGSPDVILSWRASPTSGVVGYNVYRGTTSGGESSTPLNSTPINGTTYVDANVAAGMTYYYVLTSVGSNGVQSAPSNETEATVPTS